MIELYITNIDKLRDKGMIDSILMSISAFRKEKYDNTKNDEVKLQILAVSYLMDEYLKTLGLREKEMQYESTKTGKPYFKNKENIKFSISHSKDLVGVAFSDREVGFDVQVVRSIGDEIYNRVLSDIEKDDVLNCKNDNDKLNKFFEYWVIKEAILKRDGTGLISDMKNISDDFNIVGIFDNKGLTSKKEIYYYCINNAFDKKVIINIL